jgi:hypothetical protein
VAFTVTNVALAYRVAPRFTASVERGQRHTAALRCVPSDAAIFAGKHPASELEEPPTDFFLSTIRPVLPPGMSAICGSAALAFLGGGGFLGWSLLRRRKGKSLWYMHRYSQSLHHPPLRVPGSYLPLRPRRLASRVDEFQRAAGLPLRCRWSGAS